MIKRIKIYLLEMYPPVHAFAGIGLALCFFMALSILNNTTITWNNPYIWMSSISLSIFILIIRIMDEFKDYEDDLINFPNRPLPSGRVKKSDLKVLQTILFVIAIGLNLFSYSMFIGMVIVLIFSYLMFKWFFCEESISKSLPLALITHHPIVYIYFLYIILSFIQVEGMVSYLSLLIVIPIAFTSTNWEFSRKLRTPNEENEYTTYSKIWGLQKATFAALVCQFITVIGLSIFLFLTRCPIWLTTTYIVLFSCSMIPYFRLLIFSKKGERSMRDFAELQTLLTQLCIVFYYFIGN